MKADAMANKLKHNDCAGFWKEVHTHNCTKAPLSNNIDGCFGPSGIIEMWRGHFQDIFNNVSNLTDKQYVEDRIKMASVLIISQLLVTLKRLVNVQGLTIFKQST